MGAKLAGIKRIQPIRIKYRFTHENCFSLLLGLIWADNTLISYFQAILIRIPYITDIREHIVSYIFLFALVFSIPYLLKRIDAKLFVGYLFVCSVYLLNMLLFSENEEALAENAVPFLIEALPLVFVGASVNLKKHYRMLYTISLISVIIRFIHLLLAPANFINGDMHSAYILLPHVCMVLVAAMAQKNALNILVSSLGIFMIASFGSRGPILCILFLVAIYMILFKKIHKHIWFFLLVTVSLISIVLIYEQIVQMVLSLIQKMGMSTRIFDMLLSGEIMASSGRDMIQKKLMEAISNNWFGYGIAGDRAIVGTYAHNIIVELWVSYGVVFGTILFLVPAFFAVKLLITKSRSSSVEAGFILVLISSSVVRLFMSGSYLTEAFLFLLLGVMIVEYRNMKTNN